MCVMHICDGGGNTTKHNPRHLPPLLSFAHTQAHAEGFDQNSYGLESRGQELTFVWRWSLNKVSGSLETLMYSSFKRESETNRPIQEAQGRACHSALLTICIVMAKLLIWAPTLETKERTNPIWIKMGQANLHELQRYLDHNHRETLSLGIPAKIITCFLARRTWGPMYPLLCLLPSGRSIAHRQNVLEFI